MEFEPDVILIPDLQITHFAKIYLNGQELKRCYEARIHWASFDGETFGEVIVGSESDRYVSLNKPRLGEFDREGIWVHFAAGRIRVDLDKQGKALLPRLKEQGF